MEYQVVEAQPDGLEAMHSVRFAKVVRRSVHLTPFGEDFCRTCLLDERESTAVLPDHMAPQDLDWPCGRTINSVGGWWGCSEEAGHPDRKSTRLNSSH